MSSKNTLSKIIWEFLNFVSARGREGQGKGKRKIKNTTAGSLSEWRNQIFRNFLEARAARAFLPVTPPARAARAFPPSEARRSQNRFAPCCKDTLEYYKEGFSRLLDGRPKRPPIDFGGDRPLRGRKGRGSIRRFFGRMIFYCIINNV